MFNINRRSFAIGSLATLAMGCQQTTTPNVINATSVDNGIVSRNPKLLNKQMGTVSNDEYHSMLIAKSLTTIKLCKT